MAHYFFDIPEKHKWARERLRDKLQEMGCYRLQDSVFVTPYPCQKEVIMLTSLFNVTDCVRHATTQEISYDSDIKKYFGLL